MESPWEAADSHIPRLQYGGILHLVGLVEVETILFGGL